MNWKNYFVCECGHKVATTFTEKFFAPEICPKCGNDQSDFQIKKMRWVSQSTWNPLTWGDGTWEVKDE